MYSDNDDITHQYYQFHNHYSAVVITLSVTANWSRTLYLLYRYRALSQHQPIRSSVVKSLVSNAGLSYRIIHVKTPRFKCYSIVSQLIQKRKLLELPAGRGRPCLWLFSVRAEWLGTVRAFLTNPKVVQIQANQHVNFRNLAFADAVWPRISAPSPHKIVQCHVNFSWETS